MKQQILRFLNKYKIYVGIILFFLIWMLFFDEFNWIRVSKDKRRLKNMKKEVIFLEEKITADKARIKALKTDTTALEKFAREKYFMKKSNEDIFIIIEEE